MIKLMDILLEVEHRGKKVTLERNIVKVLDSSLI